MFRFDGSMRLRLHLFADAIHWRNGGWWASEGWYRSIDENGTDVYHEITEPMEIGITEGPTYFGQEYRKPAEMSFRELAGHIEALESSGYRPTQLVVRLYQKLAYPLSAFVMVFLALPFGLNRGGRRTTTMQGVAIALGLGMGYFVLVAVFTKMGEASLLPPVLGAWAPVGLAALLALNRLTTLRT
jgi:lipopolysaccharide export LptBFGC system permease protein LptF